MYDKKLYEGMFNFTSTEQELNRPQDKIKYDTVDSFNKYYNIDLVLRAIGMYQDGAISDRYFGHWNCIYCWIIMGGFARKALGNGIRWLLIWEISDLLDSLSFTDAGDELDEEGKSNVDYCRDALVALDTVLVNIDMYQFEYAVTSTFNGSVDVLAASSTEKKFLLFGSELYLANKIKNMHRYQSAKQLQQKIDQLLSEGYQPLSRNKTVDDLDVD